MPGKNNKSQNNFEKIKKEMSKKKSKAEARNDATELRGKIKNSDIVESTRDADMVETGHNIEPKTMGKVNNTEEACHIKSVADFQSGVEEVSQDEEKIPIQVEKIEMLVFRVATEEFAFQLSCVKEIIRVPAMTKVPNAPNYIAGLCDLRDCVLPIIDGHKWFDMQDVEYNENSRIIVTDILGKSIGMISDKVSEVLSTEVSNIKEPPDSVKSINDGVVNGILMLDNGKRIIMILDAEKIGKSGEFNIDANKQQVLSNIDMADDVIKADEEEQIVAFSIGNAEYAINIHYVKEVIRFTDIMRVPNTAEYIEGVLTLRNRTIAVINFGKLLNLNCKTPDENSRVLIIDAESFTYGIIADKVSEVVHIQKDSLRNQTRITNGKDTESIKGFVSLNNGSRLIILLEPNNIITINDVAGINDGVHNKGVKEKSYMLSSNNDDLEHIVIFKVGQEEYGIEVNCVQEINRISVSVSFPGAPDFIDGMAYLRGDLIPILNLRKLLGITGTDSSLNSKIMIVEYQMKKIGITIDSVSEILGVSKEFVEEVPEVFSEEEKNKFVNAIAKLNDGNRIVLLLNLNTVLGFI